MVESTSGAHCFQQVIILPQLATAYVRTFVEIQWLQEFVKVTQPSACPQNNNMPDLRGPLRVVVKTQASPDIRFE